MDHRISWDLMGSVPKGEILSYTIFILPLSFILITFRLCDASASIACSLFYNQQPLSLHPPSSIPCPLSVLCHLITLISILHALSLSQHLFHISIFQLLAPLFHSILIFSTSIHYSLPPHSDFDYLSFCPLWLCESFSAFSVLPHSPLMRSHYLWPRKSHNSSQLRSYTNYHNCYQVIPNTILRLQ